MGLGLRLSLFCQRFLLGTGRNRDGTASKGCGPKNTHIGGAQRAALHQSEAGAVV